MRWLEFFQDPSGDYSMTRLLAFVCGLAGCYVAVRYPERWQTVSMLIGGGAVALLTRNRPTNFPTGPTSNLPLG